MIEYCEKWFFARNRAIGPLSLDDAKARHAKGDAYCAVVGGFDSPSHLVSLAGNWVSAHFFDALIRAYLNYDFERTDNRLFLSAAVFREYDDESSNILRSTVFSFSADGRILMSVDDQGQVTESETQASVDPNWANYPAFGEYTALCDEDRGTRLP